MFLCAAMFGALGSYLYKSGADAVDGTLAGYLLNPRLLAGVVCYIAVMVLFVAAYRRGGALTVLYPTYASTFVFGALIGRWAYGTPITGANVAGMLLLVGGMLLMGRQYWKQTRQTTRQATAGRCRCARPASGRRWRLRWRGAE
jgi:multidrug transporter EmrE-like cation transporter